MEQFRQPALFGVGVAIAVDIEPDCDCDPDTDSELSLMEATNRDVVRDLDWVAIRPL